MTARAATFVLVVLLGYAVFGPMLSPSGSSDTDFSATGIGPGAAHWFGTDSSGRDLFTMVANAMRVSLGIAFATALLSTAVGLAVGLAAGTFGGWWDRIAMRIADAMTAVPSLLLSLLIVAMFRGSVVAIVVSLVLTHWTTVARVVRSDVLPLRNAEYVEAAKLSGLPQRRVIRVHLLPVASAQAAIGGALLVAHAIWHESTLSFLGVGLPPHEASLGTLLSDAQESLLLGQWWLLVFPAGAIIACTLSLTVVAHSVGKERR
ncbi:putative ABC transporter permease protein [Gordonia effusa NBRC 100432]|uniref:Putative ABC transporter permease protein n=1 Tax=Gordonia effusa NBRC 100432 TaxID=1077974 RepID=H0R6I1_9ACTN|nr:ABC transporter permease [Gordonia effusa]GAB20682.1 putative ABC transporter permease protein [Gordonia effusa NBRC 100432]